MSFIWKAWKENKNTIIIGTISGAIAGVIAAIFIFKINMFKGPIASLLSTFFGALLAALGTYVSSAHDVKVQKEIKQSDIAFNVSYRLRDVEDNIASFTNILTMVNSNLDNFRKTLNKYPKNKSKTISLNSGLNQGDINYLNSTINNLESFLNEMDPQKIKISGNILLNVEKATNKKYYDDTKEKINKISWCIQQNRHSIFDLKIELDDPKNATYYIVNKDFIELTKFISNLKDDFNSYRTSFNDISKEISNKK